MQKPKSPYADLPRSAFRALVARFRTAAPKSHYNGSPLWVLVRDVTGHGSGISSELCRYFGYDPTMIIRNNTQLSQLL